MGAKVAVLDTGVDIDHPDLAGRLAATTSFIAGEGVADGHGHGTHVLGMVGGPIQPVGGVRYGVAPDAELLAAKVINDAGILAGIEWAIEQNCHVASMWLGAAAGPSINALNTEACPQADGLIRAPPILPSPALWGHQTHDKSFWSLSLAHNSHAAPCIPPCERAAGTTRVDCRCDATHPGSLDPYGADALSCVARS